MSTPLAVAGYIMRPAQLALLFALSAALVAPGVARAQDVSVGTRVRVSAPEFKVDRRTGTLTRLTADSLSVDFGGRLPPLMVAIDRVSRLEISTGKDRGAGFFRGAGIGIVAGIVAGLGVGAIMEGDCTSGPDGAFPCSLVYLVAIPGGAAVGLITGGIIGAVNPPDRWKQVSLRSGASELGMPGVRPMVFGFSVSF